jgi:hypothetical protein
MEGPIISVTGVAVEIRPLGLSDPIGGSRLLPARVRLHLPTNVNGSPQVECRTQLRRGS